MPTLSRLLVQNSSKILLVILIIAVLVRVFSVLTVPEVAYNDSVYHLELANSLIQGNSLPNDAPPFLYHIILAIFFGVTGLPMVWPFVKIIPLLLVFVQLVLAYLLFKKLFLNNYLLPLSFVAVYPWLIRIGSVNMIDSFSATILTFSCYSLYSLIESFELNSRIKEKLSANNKKYLFYSLLSFLLISFTKLNLVLVLPFLLAIFLILIVRKLSPKKAVFLFLIAVFLSASFFIFSFLNSSQNSVSIIANDSVDAASAGKFMSIFNPSVIFVSYLYFFDFPPMSAFEKIPLLNSLPQSTLMVLFAIVMLPIFIALIYGFILLLLEKTSFVFLNKNTKVNQKRSIGIFNKFSLSVCSISTKDYFYIFLALSLFAAMIPLLVVVREGSLYLRYLIPVIPIIAIFLGISFIQLGEKAKSVLLVSFILFALFSFALCSVSAIFYNNIEQKDSPLYNYINSHSEVDNVASFNKIRDLTYYINLSHYSAQKNLITLDLNSNFKDNEVYSALVLQKANYVVKTCYNDALSNVLPKLEQLGRLQKVFEDNCAVLYSVN
ncbi:MAG: hypothetical protein WCW13_02820 [archaeon]|jgi:hypothetical protein